MRLRRTGATKRPSYRVVVANQQSPRDGRFVEILGIYNPTTNPTKLELKNERVAYWLSVGAQPSDSVMRLLKQAKLVGNDGKSVAAAAAA